MDMLLLIKALILGLVEGLTEFLPVSSTGHLIIVGDLLNFNDEIGKAFEVVIQLGAILAICWEYRSRLLGVVGGLGRDVTAQRFVVNLFIAFLPAAVIGLLFIKTIKAHLFQPFTVAIAFIVGGLIIFWVEKRHRYAPRIHSVDDTRDLALWGNDHGGNDLRFVPSGGNRIFVLSGDTGDVCRVFL